jgi:HD-GYP domain-containing protein (c-di-GMP phosphodiesterase class II)
MVPPVFAPQLHNEAMQALTVLLMQVELLPVVSNAEVYPLQRCVDALADAVIDAHGQRYDVGEPIPVRDHYYAHPVKVAELSMLIARLAGGGRAQMRNCGIAAMLMNASYAQIRPGTLERARALDAAARAEMQEHPTRSFALFDQSGLPDEVLNAILHHHERWDGSGYPAGLRGKQLSIYARIVGAADTYVALCSPRPHRPARSRHEVNELFTVESGTLFDPAIVRILLEALPERYERHLEPVEPDAHEDAA